MPKGGWKSPVPLEFVIPTVEKVRCSTEGYPGGASIPIPYKNICRDWVRPLLRHYGDGAGTLRGRGRTLPHIKSYVAYSPPDPPSSASSSCSGTSLKVHWFLLTSANMSLTAWGQLQNCDTGSPELKICSYELGILLYNEDDDGSQPLVPTYLSSGASSEARLLPIPYSLPPRAYEHHDMPWNVNVDQRQPVEIVIAAVFIFVRRATTHSPKNR